MDISDQELFDGALSEDVADQGDVQAEASVAEAGEAAAQPRDAHGRFAAAQAEQAATQTDGQQPGAAGQSAEEAHVPSWRMRELREERDAAMRRAQEVEEHFRRQIDELQQRIPAKPQEPTKSIYEVDDADAFIAERARTAVDPVMNHVTQLREFYSQRDAVREHGAEKVKAAYDWIAEGVRTRDPDAAMVYQRAMQSMDPYGDIVRAHQQRTVYQQIGNDPNAWFEKQLEERMKDPTFAGSVLTKIQGTAAQANGSGKPIVRLPPSLNKATSASPMDDDGEDDSDAGLLRSALRR